MLPCCHVISSTSAASAASALSLLKRPSIPEVVQTKLRSSTRRRRARQASCEFLDGRILVLHHLGEITGEAALGQSSVKWRTGLSVLSVLSPSQSVVTAVAMNFASCLDKSNTLHALVSAKCQLP